MEQGKRDSNRKPFIYGQNWQYTPYNTPISKRTPVLVHILVRKKYDRSVLALKLKPVIAEKAKEQQGTRTDISQKSVKSHDTQKELAKVAGVSHDTIHKVEPIRQRYY